MITRILYNEERGAYSKVVNHPVQTWEWGNFQESQGHTVYRLGVFNQKKLVDAYTLSFHKIPKTNFSIGTILRGPKIDKDMLANVKKIAEKENAIFVKYEPDIIEKIYNDRYEVIKTIGEGGMANVFLAFDTILNRKVAIKILKILCFPFNAGWSSQVAR